ncbi:hypothetical protein B5X24_HaOG203637 [Helicoverpa armigera]|uniref:Uncharacterized protein n=1 Tax=Helicoverpa armigera TaxID=29058 RepID=A0A2W1BWP8_HELAM|nr:hypothetical protein B5X24_HaOG203637 [Helicoverpa armigera]
MDGDHVTPYRHLETPRRDGSHHGRSQFSEHRRSRSRSYSRGLQQREESLKREQARLHRLEQDLQKERDREQRRRTSGARGSRLPDERSNKRRGSPSPDRHTKRSRTISFGNRFGLRPDLKML